MPPPTPTLPDELLEEIFLRLPPDEPSCLVRASLANKLCLALLTGAAFRGRYIEFHGSPPMLGFLLSWLPNSEEKHRATQFVSTANSGAQMPGKSKWGQREYDSLDCRHGRILLADTSGAFRKLAVWDPMTGSRMVLDAPNESIGLGAAVLCAVTGCDHRACHDGPFRVLLFGLSGIDAEGEQRSTHVWVCSSETDKWSEPRSAVLGHEDAVINIMPSVLFENALYHMILYPDHIAILKYNMISNCMSLFDGPPWPGVITAPSPMLMTMEDGSLRFAYLDCLTIYLWSRLICSDGDTAWTQRRVVDLKELLPIENPEKIFRLVGFKENSGIIFMTTDLGIYEINLKSLEGKKQWKGKKIWKRENIRALIPYMSFYNPPERVNPCKEAHWMVQQGGHCVCASVRHCVCASVPDELPEEIFLRLPPDEPACLVRASLASNLWLGLLTGPAFRSRYVEFHGAPPMLGFLLSWIPNSHEEDHPAPHFVSTAKFGARIPDRWGREYDTLDCRHGRVLLADTSSAGFRKLAVWDPMTGCRREMVTPFESFGLGAAVLCAVTGCDHRSCHQCLFRVLLFGLSVNDIGGEHHSAHAWLYSSEIDEWSEPCSPLQLGSLYALTQQNPSLLFENAIYHKILYPDHTAILKYDIGSNCMSLLDGPPGVKIYSRAILVAMEDESLGFTYLDCSTLYRWSMQIRSDGVATWTQHRIVDLKDLLPIQYPKNKLRLIGFKEGSGIVFVSMDLGIYEINLKTLEWKKLWKRGQIRALIPYMRFYSPSERTTTPRKAAQ